MAGKNLFNPKGQGDLSADDFNAFQTQRRRVNQTYQMGLAQNQWQKDSGRTEYSNNLGDLRSQFAQLRRQLPAGFAQGGLLNSGIYSRALGDWQREKTRAEGNLHSARQDQLAGIQLANRQLGQVRTHSLNDIASAQAARRAAVAEALRSIS